MGRKEIREKGRTCTRRGREGTFGMDCPIRGAKQPLDEVRRRFVLHLELCWRQSAGYAPKYVGPMLFYAYFTRWGRQSAVQLFPYFQTTSFDTCIETQISLIQVCPTKFTAVNTSQDRILENFLDFLPKV
jgi:hypothetical protein